MKKKLEIPFAKIKKYIVSYSTWIILAVFSAVTAWVIWSYICTIQSNCPVSVTDKLSKEQWLDLLFKIEGLTIAIAGLLYTSIRIHKTDLQRRTDQKQRREDKQEAERLRRKDELTERYNEALRNLYTTDKTDLQLLGVRELFNVYQELGKERWVSGEFSKQLQTRIWDSVMEFLREIKPNKIKEGPDYRVRDKILRLFTEAEDSILVGAKLQGAKLQGANLQGADLNEAYLQGANLQGADLNEAKLQRANLQGADLNEAKLQRAYLLGAKLQGAKLQGANLLGANLQGANLREAKLEQAFFRYDKADQNMGKWENENKKYWETEGWEAMLETWEVGVFRATRETKNGRQIKVLWKRRNTSSPCQNPQKDV